jgi:hypothetical protein
MFYSRLLIFIAVILLFLNSHNAQIYGVRQKIDCVHENAYTVLSNLADCQQNEKTEHEPSLLVRYNDKIMFSIFFIIAPYMSYFCPCFDFCLTRLMV